MKMHMLLMPVLSLILQSDGSMDKEGTVVVLLWWWW